MYDVRPGRAARAAVRPLICHNANCAANATSEGDDTLEALRASLALRSPDGTAVFDGIELDSVWDRTRSACTFSHAPRADAAALGDAVALVAASIATARGTRRTRPRRTPRA